MGQSNGHASEHRLASLSVKESEVQGPKVAWSFYNPSCLDSLRSVDSSSWGLCYVRSSKNEIGPQQHTVSQHDREEAERYLYVYMYVCSCLCVYACWVHVYLCTEGNLECCFLEAVHLASFLRQVPLLAQVDRFDCQRAPEILLSPGHSTMPSIPMGF